MVGSGMLIVIAVILLVLGLTSGSSALLITSIAASLLAAVALVVGARQAAARLAEANETATGLPEDAGHRDGGAADELFGGRATNAGAAAPLARPAAWAGAADRGSVVLADPVEAPAVGAPRRRAGVPDEEYVGAANWSAGAPPNPPGPPVDGAADEALRAGGDRGADDPDPAGGHVAEPDRATGSVYDARPGHAGADIRAGRPDAGADPADAGADPADPDPALVDRGDAHDDLSRDNADREGPGWEASASATGGPTTAAGPGAPAAPESATDTRDTAAAPSPDTGYSGSDAGQLSAGTGHPSGDAGQLSAGTGHPSGDAGQLSAGTGHPSGDAGQLSSGTGRPDAGHVERTDTGRPDAEEAGRVEADAPGADDDPPDEPAPQPVSVSDAARVARLHTEVLVVDGRPRYHLAGCAHLLGRQGEALPVSEAVELGFSPCGRCAPDTRLLADARLP